MQVNGTVGTTNVKWPFEFNDVAKAFALMKVSFDWPSFGCALSQSTGNSFYVQLLGYTLFPPALIFAMFLPTFWAVATGREAVPSWRAWPSALLVLFIVYPKVRSTHWIWLSVHLLPCPSNGSKAALWQVSQTVLNGLVCVDLGLDGRFLKWDMRVDCDSAAYAPYHVYGLAMVAVWIVGYPLLLLGLLLRYNVPKIAACKRLRAEVGAFIEYSLRLESLTTEHPTAHVASPALSAELVWLLGCICHVMVLPCRSSSIAAINLRRQSPRRVLLPVHSMR